MLVLVFLFHTTITVLDAIETTEVIVTTETTFLVAEIPPPVTDAELEPRTAPELGVTVTIIADPTAGDAVLVAVLTVAVWSSVSSAEPLSDSRSRDAAAAEPGAPTSAKLPPTDGEPDPADDDP
ncbi:hypothetical protein Aduo_011812 [Ancylostoma duodenale]